MKISNKKVRFINRPIDTFELFLHNHGAMFAIVVQCSNSAIVVQRRNRSCGGACYSTVSLAVMSYRQFVIRLFLGSIFSLDFVQIVHRVQF